MARLYAATGDGIARLDETDGGWTVELYLVGTGAQCLAVDPHDRDVVYAGLRDGGVRRSRDGGRTWDDLALPEPGVFSLAVGAADSAVFAGTEPSRLFRSDDHGESCASSPVCSSYPRGRPGAFRRDPGRRMSVGSRRVRMTPT